MSPQAIAIALLTRANAYERGDLTDTSPKLLRDASGAISSLLLRLAEARAQRDALADALATIIDDACSYICSSIGRPGSPIQHSVQCKAARAALALLEAEK